MDDWDWDDWELNISTNGLCIENSKLTGVFQLERKQYSYYT